MKTTLTVRERNLIEDFSICNDCLDKCMNAILKLQVSGDLDNVALEAVVKEYATWYHQQQLDIQKLREKGISEDYAYKLSITI